MSSNNLVQVRTSPRSCPTSPSSHRRSSLVISSSSSGLQITQTAVKALSISATALTENGIKGWGLSDLIGNNIDPCSKEMLTKFQSSHTDSLEAKKQIKYFLMFAGSISIVSGAGAYYSAEYPITSSCLTSLLSCASFAFSFFINKAQADYSVNLKAEREKLCQGLRRQYEKLGEELIVKYIESTSSSKNEEMEEKSHSNTLQQHEKRTSEDTERQIIMAQAKGILNNIGNIINVIAQDLYIDSKSAIEATLPLHEAAMTIINDNGPIADTQMQTFFNQQKSYYAIKQIEIEKDNEQKACWEKLYKEINTNKYQLQKEAEQRLALAKEEIAAEAQRQAEAAGLQIKTAMHQATIDATSTAGVELEKAIKDIELAGRNQVEELAKKLDGIRDQILAESKKSISNVLSDVENMSQQVSLVKSQVTQALMQTEITQAQFETEKQKTRDEVVSIVSSIENSLNTQLVSFREELAAHLEREFSGTLAKVGSLSEKLVQLAGSVIENYGESNSQLLKENNEMQAQIADARRRALLSTPTVASRLCRLNRNALNTPASSSSSATSGIRGERWRY